MSIELKDDHGKQSQPSAQENVQSDRQVIYIYSPKFLSICNQIPRFHGRASLVHELIHAYNLLPQMNLVCPSPASEEELKSFHSEEYVTFLQRVNNTVDLEDDELLTKAEEYGFGYDCPLIPRLFDVARILGGATLTAAKELLEGTCQVAVNWAGGWHHAHKDEASGFCYVNDIVLGILRLRQKFCRVLYVDLDLHHGDGVEDAFAYTDKIMCISVHKYEDGFFPGTGSLNDIGRGFGCYHTVNVPLKDGITDEEYFSIVSRVLSAARSNFMPDVVVCQCGADTLSADPMAGFNLTPLALGRIVKLILSWNLPLLLLGGGGYNMANTARCWTYLTALLLGVKLEGDIPEHMYFLAYGPGYELELLPGNRPNFNSKEYLYEVLHTIVGNLKKLQQ